MFLCMSVRKDKQHVFKIIKTDNGNFKYKNSFQSLLSKYFVIIVYKFLIVTIKFCFVFVLMFRWLPRFRLKSKSLLMSDLIYGTYV